MKRDYFVDFYSQRLPDGRIALFQGKRPHRKRQAKWDRDNYTTLSCRVSKEDAQAFKRACLRAGKTPYMVLKEYVKSNI